MADTVTSPTAFDGKRRKTIRLTSISDSTGESGVVKVDRSAFTDSNGDTPNTIHVLSLRWNIQGFSYVKLAWHHNAGDQTIAVLSSNGYDNWEFFGGLKDPTTTNADAADGDIQLTTSGAATGASYDITIEVAY